MAAIGATLAASVASTAMPVGASTAKTMSEAAPCSVLNPTNAAPGGGYGLPTHDTLQQGVFSDSGGLGTAVAQPIGADICGTFNLPYSSGNPGNAPSPNPNVPLAGANIDAANFHYGTNVPLSAAGNLLGGQIDIFAAGPTTVTARQTPRPNGAIDIDVQTEIVAYAKNINILGVLPTTANCWLGSGSGSGPINDGGSQQAAAPATVFLSTAPGPGDGLPPGGQPAQPVTGPLASGAPAVVVARPLTVTAPQNGCTTAVSFIPGLGPITGAGAADLFNAGFLGTNQAKFSAPFILRLSLT